MNLTQFQRLQELHEKLVDVFLQEADPDLWPGKDILPANMDAKTRGDRYWSKKNAVATIALTQRIQSLVTVVREKTPEDPENPAAVSAEADDLDQQVSAAEKEAKKLLNNLQDPASKLAFDRRVHGKA